MGKASYDRGSLLISRQACKDSGCPGCARCSSPCSQKRPVDWGSKAYSRAVDAAERVLSGCQKYQVNLPDEEMLAETVRERARVGKSTALRASHDALTKLKDE